MEYEVDLAQYNTYIAQDRNREVDSIIVHHTWRPTVAQYKGIDTVKAVRRYHMETRGWSDNGYHIMFGPDGKLFLCRPILREGAHCLGKNGRSIGVCHIGDFDAVSPVNTEGWHMGILCVALLCQEYGLPASRIYGHRDFANKSCPGDRFPLAEYRQGVTGMMNSRQDVATWAEDAVRWAKQENLMLGYPDGMFHGYDPLTRQELAVVLKRLYDAVKP